MRPMSIYVAANPDDLHRLAPVLNLFFQQAIGLQSPAIAGAQPSPDLQVLMVLDESAAIRRIQILAESVS
ncbi:MAG: type IV secretory system conjugative DNA transfer family protein [Gammaproteobacteria bacterium]